MKGSYNNFLFISYKISILRFIVLDHFSCCPIRYRMSRSLSNDERVKKNGKNLAHTFYYGKINPKIYIKTIGKLFLPF